MTNKIIANLSEDEKGIVEFFSNVFLFVLTTCLILWLMNLVPIKTLSIITLVSLLLHPIVLLFFHFKNKLFPS